VIFRSEYGARCTSCLKLNPAAVLDGSGSQTCIHCRSTFSYWTEQLPFYCTEPSGEEPPRPSPAPASGAEVA
jgi:hypothetical protein